MRNPALFLLVALMTAGIARAECTDPAAAKVNWRRCFHDGRVMRGVDLTDAMLRDATFQRSDLSGARLAEADGYRTKFISATLTEAVFDHARLIEADFTRAILTGASMQQADLRNAKLVDADLRRVNFTGARLERADLRNADLAGATWTDGQKICAEGSTGQCN